jgi:hypothetical protein
MLRETYYGAFNARFLTPEQVAKNFVPLPSFSRLVREGHTVLMGSRGCGKTTLLKMLTRRALREWQLLKKDQKYSNSFRIPDYESVYIPSDTRWLNEVRDVNSQNEFNPRLREQIQRVMISASAITAVIDLFRVLIEDILGDDLAKRKLEASVCECLINLWSLRDTVPSFMDVNSRIEALMIDLRGILNSNEEERLNNHLSKLPPVLYAHSLDAAIQCCKRASVLLPKEIQPRKWAICYDELEIAPSWLHRELLSSLRSIDQDFLLKLTWSPILPQAITAPEPGADFTVIRLWNSHVQDPAPFCEKLTQAFLAARFPEVNVTPDGFLRYSIFAAEGAPSDEQEYKRDSVVYRAMKNVAARDPSFRQNLIDRDISPDDPVPAGDPVLREKQMDVFFRKAKPIVLLRQEYLNKKGGKRPRKSVLLYAGKQAVFAISEGNPRWLLGLLNDLCDSIDWSGKRESTEYQIPEGKQASVISAASRRFKALIKATPLAPDCPTPPGSLSLNALIDQLADIFSINLYGEKFPLDPIGSFKIIDKIPREVEAVIKRALEMGALVHIGKSPMDVPVKIIGERFRLSFMLCPMYKLPLRNYRYINLRHSGIVESVHRPLGTRRYEDKQMILRFDSDEDDKNI